MKLWLFYTEGGDVTAVPGIILHVIVAICYGNIVLGADVIV